MSVISSFFSACDRQQLTKMATTKPVLNLASFYAGTLKATGLTCHPLGWVKRRFTATVNGQHKDGCLILNEHFTYDDGRLFKREWVLNPLNDQKTQFIGQGADIQGNIYGESSGCAALLRYTLRVPQKGTQKSKKISVKHWQYRVDDTKTIHKITLSKWGIPLVKSYVVFDKIT